MFDSVRTRLTLQFVGVFALLLALFVTGVQVLLRRSSEERANGALRAVAEAATSMLSSELSESGMDELAARDAVRTLEFPAQSLAIYDGRGELLAERPVGITQEIPLPSTGRLAGGMLFYGAGSRHYGLRRVAAVRVVLPPGNRSYAIVTSSPMEPLLGQFETDRRLLVYASLLGLLLTSLAGWFLARRSLRPVLAMSEEAYRISAHHLDRRLPVANARDELGRLASTFNALLERLSAAFSQRQQFMADASHELRTPVSVIRTAASVTLESKYRTDADYRDALLIVERESRRMSRIIEDMFHLARADSDKLALKHETVYLDEILEQTVRSARVLAAGKKIAIEFPMPGEAVCRGDEGFLRQMFLNLLGNSVKYTPAGGSIRVTVERKEDFHLVAIADTGTGIPAEAQPHIFERFYRVNPSHSREDSDIGAGSGAGLGLSIARWVAQAHGGSLVLERSDSSGSTFVVRLPVAPEPES